jgi:hypothetical protein
VKRRTSGHSRRGAPRAIIALSAALSALGCDGVGRELVGELGRGHSAGSCLHTVACLLPDSPPAIRGVPPSPASSAACVDPRANVREGALLDGAVHCVRWNLALGAERAVEQRALDVSNAEIVISAEQPVRLTILGSSLRAARIELRGPIALRFAEQSVLYDVQVIDATSAEPSVELLDSEARRFVVAGDEDVFDGRTVVTRSRLVDAKIMARDLTLENTLFRSMEAATERLVAHSLKGEELKLEVERGAIANSNLTRFSLLRCGSLQVTSSELYDVSLTACREPLRVDRTDLLRGAVAGRIESKISGWKRISFGASADTELEFWQSSLIESALCGGTRRVALQGKVVCNLCEGSAPLAPLACHIPDEQESQLEWANPACLAIDTAAACMPLPQDEYPF